MALSRVQATPKSNSAATTVTFTFAAPPTVGNGIVVIVTSTSEAPAATACTDNKGNTYLLAKQITSVAQNISIYYCANVAATGSGFAVTVAVTGNFRALTGNAVEVSGTGGELRVDRSVSASGTSATGLTLTTGTTPALRTTGQSFVVAAIDLLNGQASITASVVSPVWTQEYEELTSGNANAPSEGDSRILSAVGGTTQSATWTIATATTWATALVAFGAATEVPPPETRVSQDAVELLALPISPPIRVSQDVIEVLSLPILPPIRVSQSVIEVLSAPNPLPVVTQLAVETLSHPTPDARSTQLVVETLTSASLIAPVDARTTQLVVETLTKAPPIITTAGRVTQLIAETLTRLPAQPPLLTQLLVETVTRIPPSPGRVTQIPVELVGQPPAPARVSQSPVELIDQHDAPTTQARVSQSPLELVDQWAPSLVQARVSQTALEIIYPFGCYVPACVTGEFLIDADAGSSTCGEFLTDTDDGGTVCGSTLPLDPT